MAINLDDVNDQIFIDATYNQIRGVGKVEALKIEAKCVLILLLQGNSFK